MNWLFPAVHLQCSIIDIIDLPGMIGPWCNGVKTVLGVINSFLIECAAYPAVKEYVPGTINLAKTYDWGGQASHIPSGEYPDECFVKQI